MTGGEVPGTGVMIDRPDAVDRDDAVWVCQDGDGWRARVYVADVARVVRLGSTTDVEACRRGRTVYAPDRTLPMLPPREQAAAALQPGRRTPACLIELSVTAAGEVASISILRVELANPVAVSYEEAAAALGDPGHRLHRMLTDAYALARTLLARRREAGALAMYDLLRGWATDEDGRIVPLAAPERNAGYLIVQELMIAANEAAARWAVEQELPILFRNHRAGTASRDDLVGQLEVATAPAGGARVGTVAEHLSTVLRPAVYEPRVGGHFGLNLPAYTHATSPLRRYPDLVTQRVLLAAAEGRSSPYGLDTLEEAAAAVNLRQEAQRARRSAALRSAVQQATRAQLDASDYQELDDASFGRLVKLAVTEGRFSPALATEIERRAGSGQLLARDAAVVLFGTRQQRWESVREQLLRWLAQEPAHALTALSMYGQRELAAQVRWHEQAAGSAHQPMFRTAAQLGEYRSPERSAPSKRAARQQAALALVAELAQLPDPSGDVPPAQPAGPAGRERSIPADHPPAMAINELAQLGRLDGLRWSFASDGAAHEPTHTCTVSARAQATGQQVTATGAGSTKAAAKAAAAAALWAQLG